MRDIRDCDLSNEQRLNFFASSPLCALSWTFSGQGILLQNHHQPDNLKDAFAFPKIAFSGPYQTPQVSRSEGSFYAITLAFYPDAFAALTGIDLARFTNKTIAAEDVLPDEFFEIAQTTSLQNEATHTFDCFTSEISPFWQRSRPAGTNVEHLVSDWFRALAVRAAFTGVGRSTRQIERRVKYWTGHSRQRLAAYAKGEKTFQYALAKSAAGQLNLADMSADLGYADQSHMGRKAKEITGFSPAEFMHRYENDESFWSFRLMGERF